MIIIRRARARSPCNGAFPTAHFNLARNLSMAANAAILGSFVYRHRSDIYTRKRKTRKGKIVIERVRR